MGLAASQAKLLSLTSRISDNELRAQSLTAAKMALANQTSEASREYLKALNTNEFVYRTYDDNGDKVFTKLTGAQLSTYAPLKNQYALINPQGQVLVSELDAANYEDSANINEFLEKYGIDKIETGKTRTVKNPEYDAAYEEWKKKYDEWLIKKPDPNDPIYWEENSTTVTDYELYDKFLWTTACCYTSSMGALSTSLGLPDGEKKDSKGTVIGEWISGGGITYYWDNGNDSGSEPNGHPECYSHVLSHLLALGSYTTSLGDSITIKSGYGNNGYYAHWWGSELGNRGGNAEEFENLINDNKDTYLCCAREDIDITQEMLTDANNGDKNAIAKMLMSDYYFDKNGDIKTKSLQQKIIDLNYAMCEDVMSNQQLYDAINHFVDSDLVNVFTKPKREFKQEDYDEDVEKWKSEEPKLDVDPTKEEKIYEYSDKDKAQWYVNLWHRMNGASDEKDGTETTTKTTSSTEVSSFGVKTTKSTDTVTRNRWDILEDGLMNSQDWLKYALESGAVTLERVNFADPTEEGTGIRKAQWTSIIYSNALDISEQTNEAAIARAEAKYQQKTREIENKDKQYDSMLKLLDTEHNALQQEYETTKTVITKNTERTIKIYQA